MNKHVLELQHIDFFSEKGSVLFHHLLNPTLVHNYRTLLSNIPGIRNVWKHSEPLKKLSFNYKFAAIAGELSRLKSLRFAFDHYFPTFESLKKFLSQGPYLHVFNSIDGLELALLINLSDTDSPHENSTSTFPSNGGSGTFFSADADPIDLSIEEVKGPFFLIAYCSPSSRYLYNALDPFTHDVKKESCGFGDRLANSYHPLVYY